MEKNEGGINPETSNISSEAQKPDLKNIRESRGLTLREISKVTRISHAVLGAIETEKFESLPEPIYTAAFIKKYAEALCVDGEDILNRYNRYLKEKEVPDKQNGALKKKSWVKSNLYFFMWGVFVFAIVSSFVFYFFHQDYIKKEDAVKKHAAEEIFESSPPKESEPVKGEENTGQAVQESKLSSNVIENKEDLIRDVPEEKVQEKIENEVKVTVIEEHSLAIKASELTWLKIAQDDARSLEIMLRPGEKLERKAKEKFLVVVGNAGGVDVIFDGKSLGTLGMHGEVVYLNLP